ncbi:reverse transcriptase domain-containing protein [Tanacetum coccineum]
MPTTTTHHRHLLPSPPPTTATHHHRLPPPPPTTATQLVATVVGGDGRWWWVAAVVVVGGGGNGYSLKDKNKAKTDKTEHGNEKSMKCQIECLALADLGASINLMPLSIWKKLSLPELTPTQMIFELADRSTTSPSGIAEDVFIKVGKFHFPADFVAINNVVDPRVPLILRRPFLRTARALIDVYGEELTLRVDDEAITFKVGQTSRYSYNDVVSINQIDVIDVACEEYAQEVLGFSSGNPTPSLDPILSTSSPSLTPFEEGDFILEDIKSCLTNDSISQGIDDDDFDPEGDLLLLEKLLNDDPLSPLPPKELHVEELKIIKSSIDDPPELELKDLPSHLEYAFLEGTDKLPVIIAKDLKEDEKKKLTEAPILVAPDWDVPFEIMYDVSDYAVGAVLGQQFDDIIRDKKGAENLAADHLSRLENPHQSDLKKKEITETFPLETFRMVTFRGDSSTPWFADIANYHAGNFIGKGMLSQQKKNFFKDVKHYFWDDPYLLEFVRIK